MQDKSVPERDPIRGLGCSHEKRMICYRQFDAARVTGHSLGLFHVSVTRAISEWACERVRK